MSLIRLTRQLAQAIMASLALSFSGGVWSTEVTVAGFAFAGDFKSAAERFPYTYKLFKTQKAAKNPSESGLFSNLMIERAKGIKNSELEYLPGTMVNLKNGDRALMAVLVMTGETVAIDDFGSYHKMFVNLRGDALIFDYKNQTIVRSCPVSVVLFDASPARPSEDRITGFVSDLIRREDGRGLVTQASRCFERATLPREGTQTVQVRKGEVSQEALAMMPESLRKNPGAVNAMLADSLASILSARLGISMLPSSIGHAVGGVMTLRLENGDDYKLKLGEGDFVVDIKLNKLVKLKTAENNVGASYVYGAYSSVRLYEPALDTTFLETDLKNGESAVVPTGQVAGDDFAAYQDAVRGLFLKLADAIQNPGSKWIGTAASAKNVETQLESVRATLRKCK